MIKLLPGRSYLYNGDLSSAELAANEIELIDQLSVDLESLGVKELREILSQAGEKPLGTNRLLWLKNGNDLSEIVQNTLLKIIEEPPSHLIIVLQARSGEDLLPTLRSRLHRVEGEASPTFAVSVFPDSLQELEKKLTGFKQRTELVTFLTQEIVALKKVLLNQPSGRTAVRIELLSRSVRRLKQNCNQKLIIDQVLLRW